MPFVRVGSGIKTERKVTKSYLVNDGSADGVVNLDPCSKNDIFIQ